jgi:hypothetical protein
MGSDSLKLLDDTMEDSGVIGGTPRQDSRKDGKTAAQAQRRASPNPSMASSADSFPSLSEVWCTAVTSRTTQTPVKAVAMTKIEGRTADAHRDREYEEAMRQLDESDNDSLEDADSIMNDVGGRVSSPEATKPFKEIPKRLPFRRTALSSEASRQAPSDDHPISPPRLLRSRSQNHPSGQSYLPDGLQVISLLTSSPEPEIMEDYAEDSIDETYEEEIGLTSKFKRLKKNRAGLRGTSVPATSRTKSKTVRSMGLSQARMSVPAASLGFNQSAKVRGKMAVQF